MMTELSYLSVPLPEDVLKLKCFGDFQGANKMIDFMLSKEIPKALRARLLLEKEIINVIGVNEYPYSFEEASSMMEEQLEDYQASELEHFKETGAADWIYINGEVRFQRRFLENLTKTIPAIAKRVKHPEEEGAGEQKQKLLNDNVAQMKEQGGRKVKIRLKATLKVKKPFEEVGRKVCLHLPLPKECMQVSDFKLIQTTPEATVVGSPTEDQRTVYFETILEENQTFTVEYEYVNTVHYVMPDPEKVSKEQPAFSLEEQLPHIRFTPYLQSLLEEIVGEETNPLKIARKIYDFVTTKVMYSFMREYVAIENISEYAACNLKGDCGVQAILFITLCRMKGIPSKWQSGLYVTELYTGCHDWAQFYVAPYGWMFADLSFGGSAYRAGQLERWNYYFGNLDVFRMPANSEIQSALNPAKRFLRADPIDNQRGEFEYEDKGLIYAQLEEKQELISMEELPYA